LDSQRTAAVLFSDCHLFAFFSDFVTIVIHFLFANIVSEVPVLNYSLMFLRANPNGVWLVIILILSITLMANIEFWKNDLF